MSFVVYRDAPTSDEVQRPQPTTPVLDSKPLINTNIAPASSLATPNELINKENYNPVTGEPLAGPSSKKRKSSTPLEGKACVALKPVKIVKAKESKEGEVKEERERKKQKKSSTSSKVKKGESSSRKSRRKSPRRASPLPRVDEEGDAEATGSGSMTQAEINSRCYDLSVKPLADVSEAYADATDAALHSNEPLVFSNKESSVEPEIRDFFLGPKVKSKPASRASSPACQPTEAKTFSTPERKKLYATFTFTTPSPTTDRIRLTRSASVPLININDASPTKRRQ